MPRSSGLNDSSLELLLDTICNTFGGVLFLAMLVSLLLTQTHKRAEQESAAADPMPAVSTADLVRMESRADDLDRELAQLQAGIAAMEDMAAEMTEAVDDEKIAAVREAERRMDELSAQRVRMLADIADTQAAAARAARETVARQRERETSEGRAQEARRRMEAASQERDRLMASAIRLQKALADAATVSTTGRAPRERGTSKREFGVMLKYGRMYLMHVFEGDERAINTADFLLTEGAEHDMAEAKPHKGLDVSGRHATTNDIRGLLIHHPPASWYPCLVVHPDSFEEFLTVKAALVSLGYEYRLLPTTSGVLDGGGKGGVVQ